MAVRAIIQWPDLRLCRKCAPVDDGENIRELTRDLLETMYDAQGRGLAAPQIGVMKRVFVMDVAWKEGAPDPLVCINPRLTATSSQIVTRAEGCLSIPGVVSAIGRPETIHLDWWDENGAKRSADFSGWYATCAQHEFDHLNGIVTFDRLDQEARTSAHAAWRAYQEKHNDRS